MTKKSDKKFSLKAGTSINGYRIEKLLGIGNFGVIYKAEDVLLSMPVAIKEYFPTSIAERIDTGAVVCTDSEQTKEFEEGKSRFVIEARIAAKFNHVNIVNILRYFFENSTAYLVMRYEPGEELSTLIKKDEFPSIIEPVLLPIFKSVLMGLKTLHAADCVHRDIKPSNILIREAGEAMLLDFGGAQASDVSGASDVKVVTPYYAPIEQYDSTIESFSPPLDIYALGATLYRCITGKPPSRSMLRQTAVNAGDKDPYQPLAPLLPDGYSVELLEVIDRMLELHESKRPQTIDEVLNIVDAVTDRQSNRTTFRAPILQEALTIISTDQLNHDLFYQSLAKIAVITDKTGTVAPTPKNPDSTAAASPPNTSGLSRFTINYPRKTAAYFQANIFTRLLTDHQLVLSGSITEGSIIWLLNADHSDLAQQLFDFSREFEKLPQTRLNLLIGIVSAPDNPDWSLATLRQTLPHNNSTNTVALMDIQPGNLEQVDTFINSVLALREAKLQIAHQEFNSTPNPL